MISPLFNSDKDIIENANFFVCFLCLLLLLLLVFLLFFSKKKMKEYYECSFIILRISFCC